MVPSWLNQVRHMNCQIKKCEIEREDANELAALRTALEEEQETVASLEEENSRFAKDRDLVKAKLKLLRKEKTKLGVLMINLLRIQKI